MLNERPNDYRTTVCKVDGSPCEGQGTDDDCDKCQQLMRRVSDLKLALGDETGWFDRAIKAEREIERWKDASGLECGGDPDGVTPEGAAAYWANIERIAQQRDDAVKGYLNCRQDLEYCKRHAHQSAAYICAKVAREYEIEDSSVAGLAWSESAARIEAARRCEKTLRDATPEGWPGGRLEWAHTNVGDGDLPRIEAWPEHRTKPHFTVQMRKPHGQEMANASVVMTHSEPDIDDMEYCISEFSIEFRDDLETCSACGGNMRYHGIAGVIDCPWCDGQGVSVMDEAMKMVIWIYNSWLTTRTLTRDGILRSAKDSTRLTDEAVNSGSCNDDELGKKCDQS